MLAVPVLVYLVGESVQDATTESLLIVGLTAYVGALAHARSGRVDARVGLAFGATTALGALAGTALNRAASGGAILSLFSVVLLVAAYAMFRGRPHTGGRRRGPVLIAVAGTGVGVLTGFFGVGGGFAIVPALTLLLGLSLPLAIGTSLLVIGLTSTVAFTAHVATGGVDLVISLPFAATAIAGALLGTRLGARVSSAKLTVGFAFLLVAVAVLLLVEQLV